MDAAEAFWAVESYEAVSIRKIMKQAGLEFSLCRYYFGSKEGLVEAVVARRAGAYFDDIHASLDRALTNAGSGGPPIDVWVRALLEPGYRRLAGKDDGWRNYARFISNFALLYEDEDYLKPHIESVMRRFLTVLNVMRPGEEERNLWFMYFMNAVGMSIYKNPRLFDYFIQGKISSDYLVIFDWLVDHLSAAFQNSTLSMPKPAPVRRERGRKVGARAR